ncbi:MAG: LVIVD repeat-containing protein, partial [Candidatus Acidiferrales bacterium]
MHSADSRFRKKIARTLLRIGALALAIALGHSAALADQLPAGWQAENFTPIGFSGLGGHPGAFKLAIKHAADGHWYLYMGHSFNEGWSILDVTDPRNPKYVKFIPFRGPDVLTAQVSLHGNIMITALNSATPRPDMGATALIWDISDPTNPKVLSKWYAGSRGSHRNSYPGGKYAYLAASVPGFRWYI